MTQQLQIPSRDCGTQVRELASDELEQVSAAGFLGGVTVAAGDIDGSAVVDTSDYAVWKRKVTPLTAPLLL